MKLACSRQDAFRALLVRAVMPLPLLAVAAVASAQEEYVRGDDWQPALAETPIMVLENGYALGGYDPVAYFELGEAAHGSEEWSYEWRDATWLFASAKHRDLFIVAPESYAPQYGGWCAYGVSGHGGDGYGAQSRPQDSWSIIDGKLYLNWSPGVVEWFRQGQEQWIPDADRQWPVVSRGIVDGERVHWQTIPSEESRRR